MRGLQGTETIPGRPQESVHRFSMRQDRRSHLEEKIRQHKCDVDCTTERTRSPHTLVCTKNKASYQAELKTYHQDQESLAAVIAIQESLPQSRTTSKSPESRQAKKARGRENEGPAAGDEASAKKLADRLARAELDRPAGERGDVFLDRVECPGP